MIEEILAEAGEKMEKTIEATKTEFAKVRTGRVLSLIHKTEPTRL